MNRSNKPLNSLDHFTFIAVTGIVGIAAFYGPLERISGSTGGLLAAFSLVLSLTLVVVAIFSRRNSPHRNIALGLFVLFCLVSGLIVTLDRPLFGILGTRGLLVPLLTAWAVSRLTVSHRLATRLRVAIQLGLLLNLAASLKQAVWGMSASELDFVINAGATYLVDGQTRLIGLQGSGQDMSILAGAALVWSISVAIRIGWKASGFLNLLLIVFSGIVTLSVLQRSTLVGVGVAFFVLCVSARKRVALQSIFWGRVLSIFALTCAAIAIFAVAAADRFAVAVDRLFSLGALEGDTSFNVRGEVTLPVALDLIRANPFGYGVGASGPVAATYPDSSPIGNFPLGGIAADNGYLYIALQLGIFGLAVFVVFLINWMFRGSLHPTSSKEFEGAGLVAFVLGIMLTGSFWGLSAPMTIVLLVAALGNRLFPHFPGDT